MIGSDRTRGLTFALVLAAIVLAAAPAPLQAQQTCAIADPANPAVRVLPAACGMAAFQIGTAQRQRGQLAVTAHSGNIYIRKIRLIYGGSASAPGQQAEVAMHRMLGAGEASPQFPTSKDGLGLMSVTVDVNPAGYGADATRLALSGANEPAAARVTNSSAITTAALPESAASTSVLDAREWVLIGSTAVHLSQQRDTIAVGRNKGRFEQLIISSRNNDLPVQTVQVVPMSGPAFAADLRTVIAAGTLSQMIAIDPPDFIREVTVTYGTTALQTRVPTLEVRGRYAESWLGRLGENRQYAGGWVLLGTADIVASPHSGLPRSGFSVQGQDGTFKRLRFVARRGAIDLAEVNVDAGNGRSETVPVNTLLVPDKDSSPIAFPNGPQAISKIVLTPRIRSQSRIDATLEVWAQY